jgi:tetratricopeptide (TPR) repeat protein
VNLNSTRRPADEGARAGAEVDRLLDTASRAAFARASRPSLPGGRRSVLDPVEALHREAGHWGELCELYLQRLDVATGDAERAKLLRRIGTILCEQLEDPAQALDAFTEALIHEPDDEPTVIALEAVANALAAWEALVKAVVARLDDDPGGARDVALSGHLVRWTKRYLERPADAEPFLARIRRIDPSHSAIHARMASVYRERGAFREQRAELETALISARTGEEKRLLHLALAELKEQRLDDRAGAVRHLEEALAIDPRGTDPMLALERLYRADERHADVMALLERQIEAAPGAGERVSAMMRLADLHEHIFVKPDRAAR